MAESLHVGRTPGLGNGRSYLVQLRSETVPMCELLFTGCFPVSCQRVDLMKQQGKLFAAVEFASIRSVVYAINSMDGKYLEGKQVKASSYVYGWRYLRIKTTSHHYWGIPSTD